MKTVKLKALAAIIIVAAVLSTVAPQIGFAEQASKQVGLAAQISEWVPVQEYYVPFPEDQLLEGLRIIESGGIAWTPVDPVTNYISISVPLDGTIIYYDHWENGYESDIANPADVFSVTNPGGTQIWGDGDPSNGSAPGVPGDIITAGTVIVLQDSVNSAYLQSGLHWGARDRIASSKAIAMSRAGWATDSGTLLASSVAALDTSKWGTEYLVPVGEDIPVADDADMFEYVGITVMACEPNTTVSVDVDADGSFGGAKDVNTVLGQGESCFVNGGVNTGARVVASSPVQVHMLTGDRGSNYESRDAALLPVSSWSDSYYTPVSTAMEVYDEQIGLVGCGTTVWLFNPHATDILVTYESRAASGVVASQIDVPAGGYAKQVIPDGSGAHFFSDGIPFYAYSTTDSTSAPPLNQSWEWSYTLIPEPALSSQVLVGLGLGRDPMSNERPNENGNPVWVTPVGNGDTPVTIYVDFDADPRTGPFIDPNGNRYDVSYDAKELERLKLFNPSKDQTGMLVYVLDHSIGLAAAWGEDPSSIYSGSPGLDAGTEVPPLPIFDASKKGTLYADVDEDGYLSPGDELLYTIKINNTSRMPIPDVLLEDILPADVTYKPGTAMLLKNPGNIAEPIPDDLSGTPFPFDEGGRVLDSANPLPVGGSYIVTFVTTVNPYGDLSEDADDIINDGIVRAVKKEIFITDKTVLYGKIGDYVWFDRNHNGIQDMGEPGIPDVAVSLYDSKGSLVATTTTDVNGKYLFTGVAAGDYIVEFDALPGYMFTLPKQGNNDALDSDADPGTGRALVSIGKGQTCLDIDAGLWRPGPAIAITKNASPTLLPADGGDVEFGFVIENTDDNGLTVTSLIDSVFGDLLDEAKAQNGDADIVLVPGEAYSFGITRGLIPDDDLVPHINIITVIGTDKDGTQATDSDDATVAFEGGDLQMYGAIGDYVWHDLDLNGIQDEGEPGIPDVTVILYDSDGDVVATKSTGPNGEYLFSDLLAGDYVVEFVNPPGYMFTLPNQGGDDTINSKPDPTTGCVPVTLAASQTILNIDAGLWKPVPKIAVTKSANPARVPETGADVDFTVTVENTGAKSVTLTGAVDTVFGTLDITEFDMTHLAVGEVATYEFTRFIKGEPDTPHVNVVTVTGEDDEGTPVADDDDATVEFEDVLPEIKITKTADPTVLPETGGNAHFTFTIENTGPEEITVIQLMDSVFGDLLDTAQAENEDQPIVLSPGAPFTFSITRQLVSAGQLAPHKNTVRVVGEDNEGNRAEDEDDATVEFTAVTPEISITKTAMPGILPEDGGSVVFTFVIKNTGVKDLTVTDLDDSVFGDLLGEAESQNGGRQICLAPDGIFTFSIERDLVSEDLLPHVNEITVTGVDDDGQTATDSDEAEVLFAGEETPQITVTKSVAPSVLKQTGANATFTVVAQNTGTVPVTLVDAFDSVFGPIDISSFNKLYLVPGDSATCQFIKWLESDNLEPHYNVVRVMAEDDNGVQVEDDDDATVTFTEVLPEIEITKTPSRTMLPETGGSVQFAFSIRNSSLKDLTVTDLRDSIFGDLLAEAEAKNGGNPIRLVPDGTYSFSITRILVAPESKLPHTNRVDVVGTDDNGNETKAYDTATVEFSHVPPIIEVTKEVDKPEAVEPGGIFNYTVVVTNTGSKAVTLTKVSDDKYGVLYEGADITLLPGGSEQFGFQMTHNLEGEYKNTVYATAVDDNGESITVSDDAKVIVRKSGISVTKTSDAPKGGVPYGSKVTYTYIVKNVGKITLYDVVATDNKLGIVGRVAKLEPGESVTFTKTTILNETTTNIVVAIGKDKDGNIVRDDDTVTVETFLPYNEDDPKYPKKQNPPLLPYTGGTIATLFIASGVSVLIGGYLRRRVEEG
ncbi:MAG: hypothetical protein FWE94_05015 [Coriobacteriia bacterium]|nr:hypothetical protein [Coriobacteriia bacterium]